jgi:DNA-binding transcriptional ArsR family regulator
VEGLAGLFAILADETRTKVLFALSQEELCVCDLAGLVGMNVSTVSHHLRLLRMADVIRFRKEGRMVYYSLADDHIRTLLEVGQAHFSEGRK